MIQFNLLPDIKLEYIKAKRTKRTIALIAVIVSGASIAIAVVLIIAVHFAQKKNLSDLNRDIASEISDLESHADLNKILTIQNQLTSLPALHDQKPVTTRLYKYLPQIVPVGVKIASLSINFDENKIDMVGTSDSPAINNKFVDTLKFTRYRLKITENGQTTETEAPAFQDVVLASHGRDKAGASYSISFTFDPIIFAVNSDVKLIVQKGLITTRSETEKPTEDLFQPLQPEEEGGQ